VAWNAAVRKPTEWHVPFFLHMRHQFRHTRPGHIKQLRLPLLLSLNPSSTEARCLDVMISTLRNTLGMLSDVWPPKPKWTAEDVPDLAGKVMLVTGGNSGIGKETAKVLLQHNAKVYIACRSAEKARAATEELKSVTGKTDDDLKVLSMDLSDLATIKVAVDEFLRFESRLDVLFNSAGVMWCPIDQITTHGYDMQFGTNVIGHFYLTQLLLPTLIASAESSPDKHVRVVNVASNGHWGAPIAEKGGPILYDTLIDGPERTKFGNTTVLYFQSKAGNVMFSNALARKYGPRGIVSSSLNPGGIRTELTRYTNPWVDWVLDKFFFHPVSLGVLTSLYTGTSPEGAQLNGKYLAPWARVWYCRSDMDDVDKQEELWTWLEGEVKKHAP